MQETSGGANIFGHDTTIFAGAGEVTKSKYLAYKKQRGPKGEGGMQGVGPLQLTFFTLQDEADDRGGCWKPSCERRSALVPASASPVVSTSLRGRIVFI